MEVSRRRGTATKNGVVVGSVWESRMKLDEVKGGIRVFNGEENSQVIEGKSSPEDSVTVLRGDKKSGTMSPKQSPVGKRKTWKSESLDGSPIQIARQRSENSKNLDEQCKELSVSADGIKKSPIQIKKKRSDASKEENASDNGSEKSPVQTIKARSLSGKKTGESSDATEKNSTQLRKVKSDVSKSDESESNSELRKVKSETSEAVDESFDGKVKNSLQLVKAKFLSNKAADDNSKNSDIPSNGIQRNSVELKKTKFEENKIVGESGNNLEGTVEVIEKSPMTIKSIRSEENCKELVVCEEKVITTTIGNVMKVKTPLKLELKDDHEDAREEEEEWDEVMEEEVEEENKVEIEKKTLVLKEISIPEQKPKKVAVEEKKVQSRNERQTPMSSILKKQPLPNTNHARIHPTPIKSKSIPVPDEFYRTPRSHSRLQSLVDLVMWRDASRSALVFGIGTFVIISSSYTKDLNISLISVLSYLGLFYLAAIFLLRSLLYRGTFDTGERSQDYVLGEEEAVWLVKLVLPYINECLLKIRALFSGHPATTMKMAVLLFVLGRCGSSLTIWKMAKLGFFGVFTVPKLCSSYSNQITAYGKFWIRRFRDAWESCTHKKAVAFAIFTLVWNLSSIVARIWAVFMLYVAFRYYQHSLLVREEWIGEETSVEEEEEEEDCRQATVRGQNLRQGRRPISMETRKQKKTL